MGAHHDKTANLQGTARLGGAYGITLSPDHIGDDGEAIVALSSSCKTLYENEVLQKARINIRLFRAISPKLYTTMPIGCVVGDALSCS